MVAYVVTEMHEDVRRSVVCCNTVCIEVTCTLLVSCYRDYRIEKVPTVLVTRAAEHCKRERPASVDEAGRSYSLR